METGSSRLLFYSVMVALNVARTGGVVEIRVRVVKGVLADLTH